MTDYVTIRGRRVRERNLWALLGIVGFYLPGIVSVLWLLLFQFPPLLILPIGALVWFGSRVRGSTDAGRLRRWVVAAWLTLTSLWFLGVLAIVYPPGSDLPDGSALAVSVALGWIFFLSGSAAIAVTAYGFARRRLAAPFAPA